MNTLPRSAWCRMWLWAAMLRPLKRVVPFGTLVRWARTRPREPRRDGLEQPLAAFVATTGRFPRRAPGNCLERSLAVYRLLCAAGARPDVIVGIRRNGAGGIEGHVWVAVDGRPFAEPRGALEGYVTLVRYDADAVPHADNDAPVDLTGVRLA